MRKLFVFVLFLLISHFICGQQIFSKIPIRDVAVDPKQIDNIIGSTLNDSVLLIFNYIKPNDPSKAFWVLPDGNVAKLESEHFKNKLFTNLIESGDSIYFYFLEYGAGKHALRAVIQNKKNGNIILSEKQIPITGNFIKIVNTGTHHYLISFNYQLSIGNQKSLIHISEINGLTVMSEKIIESPINLNPSTPSVFVVKNEISSSGLAWSLRKIYQEGDQLYVYSDETSSASGTPTQTSILTVNLPTGNTTIRNIIDNSKIAFSTYIENEYLYKISMSYSTGCLISIYNLSDLQLIHSIKIDNKKKIRQIKVFDRNFTTINNEYISYTASNKGYPFITATKIDSSLTVLKLGTQYVIDKSKSPNYNRHHHSDPIDNSFIGFFLDVAFTIALDNAPIQKSDPKDVNQHLYLHWSGANEPTYSDNPKSINEVIDAYDVDSYKQKRKFQFKGYIPGQNKVFGIYYEASESSLNIIKFTKP